MIIEGGTALTSIEVASYPDRGFDRNFALGTLTIGGKDSGEVMLTNRITNAHFGDPNQERLAVLNLAMKERSSLDLNGLGVNVFRPVGDLAGALKMSGGTLVALNGLKLGSNGTLSGSGSFTGSLTNSGRIDLGSNLSDLAIKGNALIASALSGSGTLAPGSSPGVLNLQGDFTQTSLGALDIELSARSVTAQDQLNITGLARLAGKLRISLLDGFSPTLGNVFSLLRYNAREGQFESEELPILSPSLKWGLKWQVTYGGDSLILSVVPATESDADGDGISDQWELTYGLDPNFAGDALFDADGDGLTNREEFLAGTDPRNSASVLKIQAARKSINQFKVTFSSVPGKRYRLQAKDKLTDPTWTDRGSPLTAEDFTLSFSDDLETGLEERVYRVLLSP